MYLKSLLEKYSDKEILLYVDMDGVIADYEVGKPLKYDTKRPLYTSLDKLKEISLMPNVKISILSITRMNTGLEEKNIWLDKYAPFFKKENRNIISREEHGFMSSGELKLNFLKKLDIKDRVLILIDDDPLVLKTISEGIDDIILLKDTVLVD